MLATHPSILEVGVVAIPDSHWGERPKAFVTVKEGESVQGGDVIDWAKHKVRRVISLCSKLAMSA